MDHNLPIKINIPSFNFSTINISHSMLYDNKLSLKAKGFALMILEAAVNKDNSFSLKKVEKANSDGKDSVRTAAKQLEDAGYLKLNRIMNNGYLAGYAYEFTEKAFNYQVNYGGAEIPHGGAEIPASINNNINNTKVLSTPADKKEDMILTKVKMADAKAPPLISKKSSKSKNLAKNLETMKKMINASFSNQDIRISLKRYLDLRRKKGLSPEQWALILDELVRWMNQSGADDNQVLAKINKAFASGWMSIVFDSDFGKIDKKNAFRPDQSEFDELTAEDLKLAEGKVY